MKTALSTSALTLGFKGKPFNTVLHTDVNLEVNSGELSCILGPNGAGKSTLIKTIAGFLPPIEGEVRIFGQPVQKLSNRELSFILSVVLTDKVSVLHSRVKDIVSMGRYPYTSRFARLKQADIEQIEFAISQVGISQMKNRLFHDLSDGEKQKVLIAKALAQDTPLIVLDEPTAFLDFPSKIEVMQILLHLTRTSGKTILLSTHDVELALQVADRIWLMDKGKEIVSGSPEDLVINNRMNQFFQKENIFFDPESGTFRLSQQHRKKIGLSSTHPMTVWLRRGLERIGYEVVEPSENLDTVMMNDERNILLISPKGERSNYSSIELLLNKLKQMK
jgi:iron complex transport system ATP-binding protein